jgi:hypothetical protein
MADIKHLKNAVSQETCEVLTKFLQESVNDNVAIKDDQCPDSYSVYQRPELEMLLEAFLPKIEEETGKKLFPTYAYARLYQKGEELLCHTDRESCEYSATVTLGFDNAVWPLFVGDQGTVGDLKILGEDEQNYYAKNVDIVRMEVGDAVIYKGCEQPHWRDEFLGEWQTQVFLHYVDQEGPHAEWKYDKRPNLSQYIKDDNQVLYWYQNNAISKLSCDAMIEKFNQYELCPAEVGEGNGSGVVNTIIRDVQKIAIPHDVGIGATLTGMGLNFNKNAWNFDVDHSNQSEYLSYDKNGHYQSHCDLSFDLGEKSVRKLTVLAFLNDDFEGGKFYIQIGANKIYPHQEKGTVIAFPSFILHGVEPVTAGVRSSIVTWICGPWFK